MRNIADNGKIIFLTINGDAVLELFPGSSDVRQILEATLHLHPPPSDPNQGRILDIDLPGTIVGHQREYLVFLKDLTTLLGEAGITLTLEKKADEEKLLSKEQHIYAGLFKYGMYQVRNNDKLHQYIASNKTLKPALPPPPRSSLPPSIPPSFPPPSGGKSGEKIEVKKSEEAKMSRRGGDENYLDYIHVDYKNGKGGIVRNHAGNDDTYLPLTCTWHDKLVRISCIGDGSCFTHALLKAISPDYQEMDSAEIRVGMAEELRLYLSSQVSMDNPRTDEPYWISTSGGSLIYHTINGLKYPNYVRLREGGDMSAWIRFDPSPYGIARFFNSREWIDTSVFDIIADILELDIFVVQSSVRDLDPISSTRRKGSKRNSIVIAGNGVHYEVVALPEGKYFRTVFPPDHEFIAVLERKFNVSPPEPYDSKRFTRETIIDVLADGYTINVPQQIYENFPIDDVFRVLFEDVLEKIRLDEKQYKIIGERKPYVRKMIIMVQSPDFDAPEDEKMNIIRGLVEKEKEHGDDLDKILGDLVDTGVMREEDGHRLADAVLQ